MKDVLVIGAGISGLSAALALHRAGLSVTVLERKNHVGGVIRTRHEDGFQLETGPNTYTSTGPAINVLVKSLNLLPCAVDRQTAQKRYLLHRGRLQALPESPLGLITTPLLSLKGKWRLFYEPCQPRLKAEDPTLSEFIRHRLGDEILDRLVDPFVSGVYAGDPERLSADAVFPRLRQWELESGSLLRGALKARQQSKKSDTPKPRYELLSFADGMSTLPQAMANALPIGSVRLNTLVERLEKSEESGYQTFLASGEILQARALVLATPAHVASVLLSPLQEALSRTLSQIPYAPMCVLHTAFRRSDIAHPLDGFGFLAPRAEGLPLLGSIWSSSLFENRAPEGQVLFSNFIGGAHLPEVADWPDAQVEIQVLDNLAQIFHQPELKPTMTRLTRWRQAIPQYTPGHLQRMAQVEDGLRQLPNIYLCGNYRYGVSLNDSVVSGQTAAQAILSRLNGPSGT